VERDGCSPSECLTCTLKTEYREGSLYHESVSFIRSHHLEQFVVRLVHTAILNRDTDIANHSCKPFLRFTEGKRVHLCCLRCKP